MVRCRGERQRNGSGGCRFEERYLPVSLAQLNEDLNDDVANSSAGDEGQRTQPVLSPRPPPYADVTRHFGNLEGVAERGSMAEVSCHLLKAKLALTMSWVKEDEANLYGTFGVKVQKLPISVVMDVC